MTKALVTTSVNDRCWASIRNTGPDTNLISAIIAHANRKMQSMSNSKFLELTVKAETSMTTFSTNEDSRLMSSNRELYAALADVVALRYASLDSPAEYQDFLIERSITLKVSQKDKSHPLVRALFPEESRKTFRQSITLYGQVIDAMIATKVPADQVVSWRETSEDINDNDKPLAGLLKGKALYNSLFPKPLKINANDAGSAIKDQQPPIVLGTEVVDPATYTAFGGEFFVGYKDANGTLHLSKTSFTTVEVLAAIEQLQLAAAA